MAGLISNPVAHLDELGPRRSPDQKVRDRMQARIAKRVEKFEAQRAQEEAMNLKMQDLNPVEHQKKAVFVPKAQPPVAAPAIVKQAPPSIPPNRAAVQRILRPLEEPESPDMDLGSELERELGGESPPIPAPVEPVEADTDVDTILKRFKGNDAEIKRQLAKSYAESEKRMRQLENEKRLLMTNPTQTQAAQPSPVAVVPQQTVVTPQFKYERFKDDILDKGDQVAKEFEQYLTSTLEQKFAQPLAVAFEELIDNKVFRKFGDVVTEDNLDVIKAMAHTEPGANRWEKIVSAVQKYKTAMPQTIVKHNAEVKSMEEAAQTPAPQARTASGERKMWKQSDLQDLMQKKMRTGEWNRDPKWMRLVNAAYAEGRVLRGQ